MRTELLPPSCVHALPRRIDDLLYESLLTSFMRQRYAQRPSHPLSPIAVPGSSFAADVWGGALMIVNGVFAMLFYGDTEGAVTVDGTYLTALLLIMRAAVFAVAQLHLALRGLQHQRETEDNPHWLAHALGRNRPKLQPRDMLTLITSAILTLSCAFFAFFVIMYNLSVWLGYYEAAKAYLSSASLACYSDNRCVVYWCTSYLHPSLCRRPFAARARGTNATAYMLGGGSYALTKAVLVC